MSASQGRLAKLLLRYASPLAELRRVPVLGKCVSWAGAKLVPRDSLARVQVQSGPAEELWLPRTGRNYFEGGGEPEVQEVSRQQLRLGMIFYDIGANVECFSLPAARIVGKEGHVVAAGSGDTIEVSAESDDYAWTQQPPGFLKCDVEGAEEVFRGTKRLLKEKRPEIICEMRSEGNQRVLLEEFSRFGYGCKPCGTNRILALPR